MTEAELQQLLTDAAELNGWLVFHDNDSRLNPAGFPDLVLVKPPRIVLLELKTAKGRVRPEQQVWLDALADVDTVASALVRPEHADQILTYLRNPERHSSD